MEVRNVMGVTQKREAATLPPALWTVSGRNGQTGPPAPPAVKEECRLRAERINRLPCTEGRSVLELILRRENATNIHVLVSDIFDMIRCIVWQGIQ